MLPALSIGLAVVIAAASGHAKPKVVVFPVVPLPGEVELGPAEKMTTAILEEFGQQDEFDVVEGRPRAAAATEPGRRRRSAKSDAEYRAALGQLEDGAKLAQKLRFPRAIEALRAGIDGLTRNLELMDEYDRLLDAYVLLAVAYFRRGKQQAGADVLQHLARLRPDFELDRSKYPPVFTSELDEARQRVLTRVRGGLRVTSAPGGAEVFVNGRRMGTTPILVQEMIPGKHHLVVRLGESAWGEQVIVREDEICERHADLGAGGPNASVTVGDALAANRFDRQVRSAARRLARDAGGDYVLVSAMGRGEGVFTVSAFLCNVRSGAWTALVPLSPDHDMLSDTIEARNLTRQVVKQLGNLSNRVEQDERPLIAGKAVRSPAQGISLKESQAVFVTASMERAVARAEGARAPVRTGANEPDAGPELVALVPPPSSPPVASEPGIARDSVDIEVPDNAIATHEVDSEATGPLSVDLGEEPASAGGSLFEEWWFWAIVGVGAAALAGGGYGTYWYLTGRDADSVTVYAAW